MPNSLIADSASISPHASIGNFCIIEDNVVIEDGVRIGDYVTVRQGSRIGKNTKIGAYCMFGRRVSVGASCSFSSYCEIRDDCRLGSEVIMGSRGTLSAGTVVDNDVIMKYAFVATDTPDITRNDEKSVGRIKRGARIGALVVLMPGLTVGENAVIGACSQVRKDVPDNEVWFGIPARFYRPTHARE